MTRERVEDMKRDLIANPAVAEWWMGVWERIRRSLIRRAREADSGLGAEMRKGLADLGEALKQDERLQVQILGVVQGVGFRPFVHRLAAKEGLPGGSKALSAATFSSFASTARSSAGSSG